MLNLRSQQNRAVPATLNPSVRRTLSHEPQPPPPAAKQEQRQRSAVVAGALDRLPSGFAGHRTKKSRPSAPDRHPEDDRPDRIDEDEDAHGDVKGSDNRHQRDRRVLGDADDGEIVYPRGSEMEKTEGSMTDELHRHANPQYPENRSEGRVFSGHRSSVAYFAPG